MVHINICFTLYGFPSFSQTRFLLILFPQIHFSEFFIPQIIKSRNYNPNLFKYVNVNKRIYHRFQKLNTWHFFHVSSFRHATKKIALICCKNFKFSPSVVQSRRSEELIYKRQASILFHTPKNCWNGFHFIHFSVTKFDLSQSKSNFKVSKFKDISK